MVEALPDRALALRILVVAALLAAATAWAVVQEHEAGAHGTCALTGSLTHVSDEITGTAADESADCRGNDVAHTYRMGGGSDIVLADTKADTIYGRGGPDHLHGLAGKDTISGGKAVDNLYGYGGGDTLKGGDGGDLLVGDDGADVLRGGDGDDVCNGGFGDDTFIGCETIIDL